MIRTAVTVLALALSTFLPAQQRGQGGRPVRSDQAPRAQREVASESGQGPRAATQGAGGELARLRGRLDQLRAQLDRLDPKGGKGQREATPPRGEWQRGPQGGPGARGLGRGGMRQGPMRRVMLERLRGRFQVWRGQAWRGQENRGPGARGPRNGGVDVHDGGKRGAQRGGGRGPGHRGHRQGHGATEI